MNALELSTMKNFSNSKNIYNKRMYTNMKVVELKSLAREQGLRGYSRLRKAELINLLKNEVPTPPPRRNRGKRQPVQQVKIIPHPQEMDIFEREEMEKSRPLVKSEMNEWYDWLVNHIPKTINSKAKDVFNTFKKKISELYDKVEDKVQVTLKKIVENEAEKEHQEEDENQVEKEEDLTPQLHEHAFKKAFKSFRIPGIHKSDVDTYIEKVRPFIKVLIEEQVKELGSAKVQLQMWIKWVKKEKIGDDDDENHPQFHYVYVDKPFNSKMTEVFQDSDIEKILETMFAYVKTQTENPALPDSEFKIDHIMHLDIDFHQLQLIHGGSYIDLPAWIKMKKAVINPKNEEDEECFKWAVIASLHHEEIGRDPQRISKLEPYANRYNWNGLKFPVSVDQIKKFEKKNLEIAVNVLYIYQEGKKEDIDPSNVLGNEKEDKALKEALTKKVKSQSLDDQNSIQLVVKSSTC